MGYSTYFSGKFTLSKMLNKQKAMMRTLSHRRMCRDVNAIKEHCAKLLVDSHSEVQQKVLEVEQVVGVEGEFFHCKTLPDMLSFPLELECQEHVHLGCTCFAKDQNEPPKSQPSLWCDWQLDEGDDDEPATITFAECDKFYHYVDWLRYIMKRVLVLGDAPKLNGAMAWEGEWHADFGTLFVQDNVLTMMRSDCDGFRGCSTETPPGITTYMPDDPLTIFMKLRRWNYMRDAPLEQVPAWMQQEFQKWGPVEVEDFVL
eukprot:TRINITY_DN75222_c0_g1_i1.p1 TRINITY_DN75222_c0_g1~~TRINITY_DN75222_c0_g1_i1.p1  ORF type:complete len:258 (-),score=29.51 TRINITY_DN75222_c0_g1_i1:89-862(-)